MSSAKAALLENNIVTNIIIVDDENVIGGAILCGSEVAVGWEYNPATTTFSAPAITKTFEELKSEKLKAINGFMNNVLKGGYSYDFGGSDGVQTLQTRDCDKMNWLTLQANCKEQIDNAFGSVEGVYLRTAENNVINMTFTDANNLLIGMAIWGSAVYQVSWSKKDAVAAATTEAELDMINVETGWPS